MNSVAQSVENIRTEPDKVDERLERIREHIWPSDPYLMDLAAPSNYHLPSHLANNWRRSCPFDKNEEQLQYLTFIPHTVRGDTMLRTTGDWDDGKGNLKTGSAKQISGSSSGAISPLPGQPPRKKISLFDYNKKKAGQTGVKTSPRATVAQGVAVDKPPQAAEAMAKPIVKVSEPTRSAPVKEAPPETSEQISKPEASRGQKRSADNMTNGHEPKTSENSQASSTAKRLQTEISRSQAAAATAPARTAGVRDLPRMLSPTLPACIEERLAKLRAGTVQAESYPAQKSGSNRLAVANNKAVTTTLSTSNSPKAKNVTQDKNSEAQRSRTAAPVQKAASDLKPKASDSELNTKAIPRQDPVAAEEAPPTKTTADRTSNGSAIQLKQYSKIRPSGKDTVNTERRLLIVLRIPKGLRRNCQRILQLQPRPKKLAFGSLQSSLLAHQEGNHDQSTSKNKTGEQTLKQSTVNGGHSRKSVNGLMAPGSGETRGQANPDKEPPSKHQRLSGIDFSRPQTPVGSALRSPGPPLHNSGSGTQLSTPKTERKSTAMDRIKSSEGEVKTPLGSIRSNTPLIPGSAEASHNREGRSSSNVSASSVAVPSKDEEVSMYKAEFSKYADMAKSLKREADVLAKAPGGGFNPDTTLRRQGLAKAVETALCYMLAFTIKDEQSRIKKVAGDHLIWETLPPYFKFLKNLTCETESLQLQGLLCQLEAICRESIHRCYIERLERERDVDETLIKQVGENLRQARQAWIEGTKGLTHDDLRQYFPETWAQRSKWPGDKTERVLPKRYHEGSYFLPLNNTSTTLEAVRAGWCFLEEWCKKEGVDWSGKMGL